jgi:hypothetical protein
VIFLLFIIDKAKFAAGARLPARNASHNEAGGHLAPHVSKQKKQGTTLLLHKFSNKS